jgi:hypothetical protein
LFAAIAELPARGINSFSGQIAENRKNSLAYLDHSANDRADRKAFDRAKKDISAKKTFTAAQLKEDFDILKKTLTTIHPGIYRYQTPQSLERIFKEYEAKLAKPLGESEFFKMISQLTSLIRCGHTYPNPYNQDAALRERIFGGANRLPFYFRIIDNKIIVTENASARNLAAGSEIKKINGVAAKEIIGKLLTVTKADGENTLGHRIQSIELTRFEAERYALFDWYYPLFFPMKTDSFTIEAVDFAAKKKTKFQTPAMTKTERDAEMEKRYGKAPTYDDGWKFELRGDSTAYLKIDNSITWRLKKIKFQKFLADAFAETSLKEIKNLIIDLRGNGGGDMNVGYELSKYLAAKKSPVYAANRRLLRNVAAQTELAKYLDTYDDNLKVTLKNGVPTNLYRKAELDFFEITPSADLESFPAVMPYENNFVGRAFIISDESNASATFQFLDYVKENRLALIVGQTTGGNRQGINGGNYFFLRLPNSRIEIDVPVYFQAALTAQKDESVAPDILVKRKPQDVGNNFVRELRTIKKIIARK